MMSSSATGSTAFSSDCCSWLDSTLSSSASSSNPDSPTSPNVGLSDAWSPFSPWCRGPAGGRLNYPDALDQLSIAADVARANALIAGVGGSCGMHVWPMS